MNVKTTGELVRATTRTALIAVVAGVALFALPAPASAASWQDAGSPSSDCYNEGVEGWSFYRFCWAKKKRVNDNTPTKDVFAFRTSISGYATNGKYLAKLWTEPMPRSSSPAMSWEGVDSYKPDTSTSTSTNCKSWSWSVGVSYVVEAAFTQTSEICDQEKYYPKFYDADGHHAGVWSVTGSCIPAGSGNTRKAAVGMVVRVGQGKVPLWDSARRGANAYSSSSSC